MVFPLSIVVAKTTALCIFFVLAIVGNTLLCYAIYTRKKLRTVPNYLVLNLAVADLLFALTCMPPIIITSVYQKWVLGDLLCQMCGMINTWLCVVSIWIITIISVNRYFAVAKSKSCATVFPGKKYYVSVACAWAIAAVIAILPLFGWGQILPGDNLCTLDIRAEASLVIVIMVTCYGIPFPIIGFLYACIYFELKKHRSMLRSTMSKENIDSVSTAPPSPAMTSKQSLTPDDARSHIVSTAKLLVQAKQKGLVSSLRSLRSINGSLSSEIVCSTAAHRESCFARNYLREARVTRMLFVVVLAFCLCWTPIVVGSGLLAMGIQSKRFQVITFGVTMACLSSTLNPIICSYMSTSYRRAFCEILSSIKSFMKCTNKHDEEK